MKAMTGAIKKKILAKAANLKLKDGSNYLTQNDGKKTKKKVSKEDFMSTEVDIAHLDSLAGQPV